MPTTVRLRAISLIDAKRSPQRLLALFTRFKNGAWSKSSYIRLAAATIAALGPLKEAQSVLLRTASDPAFPGIQAAAITALGTHCPQKANRIFNALRRSADHQVATAARSAANVCKKKQTPRHP